MIWFLADEEPLPNYRRVNDGNAETFKLIKSLKVNNKLYLIT